jgi:uncharacterized delta-60 repeat protein
MSLPRAPRSLALLLAFASLLVAPARAQVDGGLDPRFGSGGTFRAYLDAGGSNADYANAVAVQPDGKVVVAGAVATAGGDLFGIVRLLPDGGFDPSFGTGGKVVDGWWPDEAATDLALASDGTIYVAGYWRNSIATLRHYGATGQLLHWTETVGQAGSSVRVAIATDARILLGYTDGTVSNYDFVVRKYHWDLTPDATFGSSGEARVAFDLGGDGKDFLGDLAVQPDGKIVLAGSAQYAGQDYDVAVARLTWFGLVDSCCFGTLGRVTVPIDFVAGGYDGAVALALQGDGGIAVAGKAESYSPPGYGILFRLAANGAWDPVFGLRSFHPPWANAMSVSDLARQDDGRLVVVGGGFDLSAGENDGWALRFLPSGALDGSFGSGGMARVAIPSGGATHPDDWAAALALQGNAPILVGPAEWSSPDFDFGVVRLWNALVFRDGFESGSTARWSSAVP